MKMDGAQRIPASREAVWAALNDPEVLRDCIPGCESIDKTSDTRFTAKVTTKIGPVKARFSGDITLSDLDPPRAYTISGQGKGGPAGFARGGAKVQLEADGDATMLHYKVEASVGGKLAQIGSRLIDGAASKMANDFFTRFAAAVGQPETPAGSATALAGTALAGTALAGDESAASAEPEQRTADALPAADPVPEGEAPVSAGLAPWLWVAGLVALLAAVAAAVSLFG